MFGLDAHKLELYLLAVEAGYPDSNQYHNRSHGASVLHFTHMLLTHGGLLDAVEVGLVEVMKEPTRRRGFVMLAAMLAATVHDFEHLGVSNDFLVKTQSERAITYNDRSPNEQHHVSAAWRLLLKPELNFMESLSPEESLQLRRLVVDLVLATDMAEHGRLLEDFQGLAKAEGDGAMRAASPRDAHIVLKIAIKCADLGHLALGWDKHLRWVHRLEAEFFQQGDREKQFGLDCVSFLMDRHKPGVTESQVGFFDYMVLPLFRTLLKAFPQAIGMVRNVETNYRHWCDAHGDVATVSATA